MPKKAIIPAGTSTPIAPFVPGSMADNILYVSGTLPFDENNDVVHVGDAEAQTRHVLETIKSVILIGTVFHMPLFSLWQFRLCLTPIN